MAIEDLDTKVVEDGRDGFPTDHMAYNRYEADLGIYMVGITSPDGFQGQSSAFVQLCAETMTQSADWTASRVNAPPTIPDPQLVNADWVLLRKMPELAMVTLCADGQTPLYRVTGTYVYGKRSTGRDSLTNVSFPKPAWLADTELRTLPAEIRQKGLIDSTQTNSMGGTTAYEKTDQVRMMTGYITGV